MSRNEGNVSSLVSLRNEKMRPALQGQLLKLIKLMDVTTDGRIEFGHVLDQLFTDTDFIRSYARPLANVYRASERRIDAVIGCGNLGAIMAFTLAEELKNLYGGQHPVAALSFKSIDVPNQKVDFELDTYDRAFRNRRTLFVVPVLDASVWPSIKIGADIITDSRHLGSVCGIATFIQCGQIGRAHV